MSKGNGNGKVKSSELCREPQGRKRGGQDGPGMQHNATIACAAARQADKGLMEKRDLC